MYYVGQSITVLHRAAHHFQGRGNGDVYADYKYGDNFEILIKTCISEDLDDLESFLIKKYDAYDKGYNKNLGNSAYKFE